MDAKVFALVDCNSFFCSCERLFRPDLRKRPVGVLSNNDGCFVSRTKELKALGVPMGAPYFQYKDLCRKHQVAVFSSNFALYTNLSDRVMLTLSQFTPELEVYSVDEAFLDLTGFKNPEAYARKIKDTVERQTGIPVSIGLGPSKTLAKVANHIAKKSERARGVVALLEPHLQTEALRRTPVEDIWGVGRAISSQLRRMGIQTALEFRDYKNDHHIKKLFTKVGLQRKEELQGKARFRLELVPSKKKEILSSRSFGRPVTSLEGLRQAVATYVSKAAVKLRRQQSLCLHIEVFARTSPFGNRPHYGAYGGAKMETATANTSKIIRYAFSVLEELYKQGYDYKKAGIRLGEFVDHNQAQLSLFQPQEDPKQEQLMACMDAINQKQGDNTIYIAACGIQPKWTMNREFRSPQFVTGWRELPQVK